MIVLIEIYILELTLREFGFPSQTLKIIMALTTSTSLSLKWNNESLDSFKPTGGLRQGDPLSPCFFVLCMEKLALMVQNKVKENQRQPVNISRNGPKISHPFFVDDCLLFTKAKSSQVRLVQQVLHDFCKASGLKVSIQKSRFMASRNISRIKTDKFTTFGFNHTVKVDKYLGFPLLVGS